MKSKAIKVRNIDGLQWPGKCLCCGQNLEKGDAVDIEVKVKKKAATLFVGGFIPRRLLIKYCGACADKISLFKTLETVGNLTLFAAIIWVGVLNKRETPEVYIGGAVFWLGGILMAIAKIGSQKALGVECKLIAESIWEFKLRNNIYYDEFLRLNSKFIHRI